MNQEAARHARAKFGLDVRTDDFLAAEPAELGGPFDVAVLWDVLEHLERPERYLARVAELAKPGALLFLTTGDIGSPLARLRGRKWRLIHPPSHLHYFDRATIARLLGNCGFRVLEIRSTGTARSLRQALYSLLVLRLGMKRAYQSLQHLLPAGWGFSLNTLDIMQVIAENTAVELYPSAQGKKL